MTAGKKIHAFSEYVFKHSPEEAMKKVIVRPDGMKFNTKEGRVWKKKHEELEILETDEFLLRRSICAYAASHPDFKGKLLTEQKLIHVPSKMEGIIDLINEDKSLFFEIKTTGKEDLSRFAFYKEREILYQVLFYHKLIFDKYGRDFDFKWLIIESSSPFRVALWPQSEKQHRYLEENLLVAAKSLWGDESEGIVGDFTIYCEFYNRLVDFFGFDFIKDSKPEQETYEFEKEAMGKLLKDPYFSPLIQEEIEFNSFNIQKMLKSKRR